jgi:O-Antigen ligase
MNNNAAILRSLIIYSICVPFAIWMGFLLAAENPLYERSNWIIWGLLALLLCAPILLRWHHLLLISCWNFGMMLFFLPGLPHLWMPMVCLSLAISILHRTLNSEARFISAPQITWPLVCLTAVVLMTARLTGGIGLHSLGNEVMGGKKYVTLLVGILGYFALTARRIPPNRAGVAVALFFLGYCSAAIGDLVSITPSSLRFIFWLFPPNTYAFTSEVGTGLLRLGGVSVTCAALFWLLLAKYGIRGIFMSGKLWRPVALILFFTLTLFGGFRSIVVTCALLFTIQFFLEGMHRTKLFPALMMFGIVMAVLCVPFADKLPNTFQRALAFLPVKINPDVRRDAESSTDWRIAMWKAVLPEIPSHLLLGKGYALSAFDLQNMSQAFHPVDAADTSSAVAGDYHSGPLSVILPFGIWGVIAFMWFLIAGCRALYHNYCYGPPELRTINALLFSQFLTKIIMFIFVFGALSDIEQFTGLLGLGVALNGGVCRPAPKPVQQLHKMQPAASTSPQFQPAFPR